MVKYKTSKKIIWIILLSAVLILLLGTSIILIKERNLNIHESINKIGTQTSLGFNLYIPPNWTISDNKYNIILTKENNTLSTVEIETNGGSLTPPVSRLENEPFEVWVKRFSKADTAFAEGTPMRFESEFTLISSSEVLEKRTAYNSEYGPGPYTVYKLYIDSDNPKIKNYELSATEKNKDLINEVKSFIIQ